MADSCYFDVAAPSVALTLEQMMAPISTPTASGPVAVVHGVGSHAWRAEAFHPLSGSDDSISTVTFVDSRSSSDDTVVEYVMFSAKYISCAVRTAPRSLRNVA